MKRNLTFFSMQRGITVGFAVLIAVIVSHYFSFTKMGWIVLVTFLVSQTTRGTPLKHGIIIFLFITAGIFSYALMINIKQPEINEIIIAIIFIIFSYITYLNRPQSSRVFFVSILFPLVLLIAMLEPTRPPLLQDRLIDVLIGAAIGIVMGQIVFPVNFDKEFSEGVVPLLRKLKSYSHALTEHFLKKESNTEELEKQKYQIEKILLEGYPEWVYEFGFNPGLRSGYRFFLVNLERITEIFFSMDYLAFRQVNLILLENLAEQIQQVVQKNQELFFYFN